MIRARLLRHLRLLVPPLFLALPAASMEGVPDHTGKRIAAVQVVGPVRSNLAELTRFLEVRKGDIYSPRKVRRTIEVLAKLGNFNRISVEAIETAEGLVLTVRLEPIPRIKKITLRGVESGKTRVTNALAVSPGDPVTGVEELRRMAEDVKLAYHRAGYKDAEVEVLVRAAGEGDVELECIVKEGRRMLVRSVEFKGEFEDAVDRTTLEKESGLRVGDAVTDPALESAGDRLIAYLRKLGYLEARVPRAIPVEHEESGDADVTFLVQPGERIEVRFDKKPVAWADQRRSPLWFWDFRDSRLMALLDLENEAYFTSGFAAEGADRIEAYYERRGYYETQVTDTFELNEAKRLKTFTFKIRPGRRFTLDKVVFRGTENAPPEIRPRVLLRELLSQSRALDDRHYVPQDVDAALLHVTNYLRSRGYDGARIEPDEPEVDHSRRRVRLSFRVEPGPRALVGRVTFRGNRAAPEGKLRSIIREDPVGILPGAPLNTVFLDRADEALEEHYARIGFPYSDARHTLELREPEEDEVAEEGLEDTSEGAGRIGALAPALAPARTPELAEPPGAARDPAPVNERAGAPAHVVDVHYSIDESFQSYIGRVIIRGNRYTNRAAIERALPFKTGETYTPQALASGQDALYKLGPFARVSVAPTEQGEPERVRDILVSVTEANRIVVEPSVGVSWPEEGPRVGLRAQHRNLFGNGESLSLRAQANWRWTGLLGDTRGVNKVAPAVDYTQIEERVLLTYAQPTTFGYPLNGSVTTSLFEREQNRAFGYTGNRVVGAADQSLDFDVPVLRNADVRLVGRYQMFLRGIQYESRGQADAVAVVREDFAFPIGEMFYWPGKWKIASGSLGALVDGRNDRFNPTAGYTFTFSGEIADALLGSDSDFARLSVAWSLFRPAPAKFSFAMSVRGGVAHPMGRSNGIPVDQRYHLGGTGSVRGFRESEIGPRFESVRTISAGGDSSVAYSAELRHRLIGGLDWVAFTDGGWSRLDHREPDPPDVVRGRLHNPTRLATSVGLGLRVKTPVGPFKFDLGVNTEEADQLDSINGTREHVLMHFTIGDF